MTRNRLVHVSLFPGWIVSVTQRSALGYQCWVVTPELVVLSDGELYSSDLKALAAGRMLVELSMEAGFDAGQNHPFDP